MGGGEKRVVRKQRRDEEGKEWGGGSPKGHIDGGAAPLRILHLLGREINKMMEIRSVCVYV